MKEIENKKAKKYVFNNTNSNSSVLLRKADMKENEKESEEENDKENSTFPMIVYDTESDKDEELVEPKTLPKILRLTQTDDCIRVIKQLNYKSLRNMFKNEFIFTCQQTNDDINKQLNDINTQIWRLFSIKQMVCTMTLLLLFNK